MTDNEIAALYQQAQAEFSAGEELMLVHPLLIMGIVERLSRAEEQIEAAGAYDVLHD